MAGSADVEPTESKPHVSWASIKDSVVGAAGRLEVAFTHSAEEGVYGQVIKDLSEAIKVVFANHGYTL